MALSLPDLVFDAADQAPDAPALVFRGRVLTYSELADKVGRLARVLINEGVHPGDPVGIYVSRGVEGVIGVYGAMAAGAIYVPLDPLAPPSRQASIISDCGIRHLITEDAKLGTVRRLLQEGAQLVSVVGPREDVAPRIRVVPWEHVWSTAPPLIVARPSAGDLACLLYTADPSGIPRGIVHTHQGMLKCAQWAVATFSIDRADRLSHIVPLQFGMSVIDLFASRLALACTVIVPDDVAKAPASLSALIAEERVTIWCSVPFALIQLLRHGALAQRDLTRLRTVIFGGEQFPARPLRELMLALPETSFYNVYGSTEVLVGTCHRLSAPPPADAWIPIGRPRADADTLVLGEGEKPAADGDVGVLCIQSPSVMFCYWRRAELTERAFYSRGAHFFYRTGDLVELGRDGNYYFLGRLDRQVKSRGYRVELEEVEAALRTHPQVYDARVHLVPHGDEVGRITATVVLRDHATLTVPGLKNYLAGRLPLYAVPTTIVFLGDALSMVEALGAEHREVRR